MTKDETTAIMAIIKAAYPQFYSKATNNDIQQYVSIWAQSLEGDNTEFITAAVRVFIANDNSGFPPTIGQIRSEYMELIEMVKKQKEYGFTLNEWYGESHMRKFPPVVKKLLEKYTNDKNRVGTTSNIRLMEAVE